MERIFVSVASYQDEMLSFTLKSAVLNAEKPSRLHFSVVNQGDPIKVDLRPSLLSMVELNPLHSGGACWARSLAQANYDGEDFYLQIDSHTLFKQGWDETLIAEYDAISRLSEDFVISTRPQAFDYDTVSGAKPRPFTANTIKLVPRKPLVSRSSPAIMCNAHASKSTSPLLGYQVSAAFLFGKGDFARRIPYDPMLYFHGEEQNLAVRCFTHAIDIYHTANVPLYHLYKKRDVAEPALHWSTELDRDRAIRYARRKARADDILWKQLTERYEGPYGNGIKRPVESYLEQFGLNLDIDV